jgi:low affinity Fe/Cu permease
MSVQSHVDDKSTAVTRAVGRITGWLGSFPAILLSLLVVGAWFAGAFFVTNRFANDTYQLLINTGTTIITFWMVFIIQNTQNRDGRAMQAKLDAQTQVLCAIAERLGIDADADVLEGLVGLEDAPERVIKEDQQHVRTNGAVPSNASSTSNEWVESGRGKASPGQVDTPPTPSSEVTQQ